MLYVIGVIGEKERGETEQKFISFDMYEIQVQIPEGEVSKLEF